MKNSNLNSYKSIRKVWNINPKTKVKENKKKYNRQLTKKQLNNILKQEDF